MSRPRTNKEGQKDTKVPSKPPATREEKKNPHANMIGGLGASIAAFAQTLRDPYRTILSILSPLFIAFVSGFAPPLLDLATKVGRDLIRWMYDKRFELNSNKDIKKCEREMKKLEPGDSGIAEYQGIIDKYKAAKIDNAKQAADDHISEAKMPPPLESLRNIPR